MRFAGALITDLNSFGRLATHTHRDLSDFLSSGSKVGVKGVVGTLSLDCCQRSCLLSQRKKRDNDYDQEKNNENEKGDRSE